MGVDRDPDRLDVRPVQVAVAVQRQAGLVAITSELAADSSPAAAQVVGEGLVRDLARTRQRLFRQHSHKRTKWVAVHRIDQCR